MFNVQCSIKKIRNDIMRLGFLMLILKKLPFSVYRLIGQCLSFANLSHFLGVLALILSSTNGKRMVLG